MGLLLRAHLVVWPPFLRLVACPTSMKSRDRKHEARPGHVREACPGRAENLSKDNAVETAAAIEQTNYTGIEPCLMILVITSVKVSISSSVV